MFFTIVGFLSGFYDLAADKIQCVMDKLLQFFLLFLAVTACQDPLFEQTPRSDPQGGGAPRDTLPPPAEQEPPVPDIYATAFVFPEGADWKEPEQADVVLFKNGEELLRVPVEGRPEPDRHRISEGRLWTDSCDGREVVVSCNGEERFRYEGDELLRGFFTVNGIVYTLGQRQGRGGFSYRINGKERFSSPAGTVLGGPEDSEWEGGAFSRDSSGVYYTYGLPIWKGEQLQWEYHVMREEELLMMIPSGRIVGALYDIRVHDRTVYRTELRSSYSSSYCLVRGENSYQDLKVVSPETPHYLKLVPGDGKLLVKGYSTGISGGKAYCYWLRDISSVERMVTDNQPILDLLTHGPHTAYLVEGPGHTVRTLYLDKENIPFTSDRYQLLSGRCAQYKKGVLGIALSDPARGEHLLVRDREVTSLAFNGYFTSLQIH